MGSTYSECRNLNMSKAILIESKVVNMSQTFKNTNYSGTDSLRLYIKSNNVTNLTKVFYNKPSTIPLSIFVHAGSTTFNTAISNSASSSVTGTALSIIDDMNTHGCYMDSTNKVYIYPLDDVQAFYKENEIIEPTITVEAVSGASYGFSLGSDGYYESGNKGIGNSAALCKVIIDNPGEYEIIFDCINYAEGSYDYGILSQVNKPLETTNLDDGSSDTVTVKRNFKGSQSSSIQPVSYGVVNGTIYVKFRKDGSVDTNNDSLKFKVRFIEPQ
jgi:hypothetical protein